MENEMKRKFYNVIKHAATPQIGIFWVYKGQVIQFSESVNNVAAIGGFKDSEHSHDAHLGQMQKMHPELAVKEYFDIPRGRILYVVNGTYKIILPSKLSKNAVMISKIKKSFSLPPAKTIVETDLHYGPPPRDSMDDVED
jgi:hypothetical protein